MTYKLTDVKQVCEVIYGKPIQLRTWRKWKNKLGFPPYIKVVDENMLTQLLTLANMKREKPFDKIKLTDVIKAKQTVLEDFKNTRYSYRLFLIPDECKGRDIQGIIKMVTGRLVSRPSLYRWGEINCIPYNPDKNYKKDEVMRFILQTD